MIRPNETITPIPDTNPDAVPELWNKRFREIDENEDALDAALQSAISSIASNTSRITAVENESAGSVSQALRLDWLYSSKTKLALELFYDSWTLLPGLETVVTDAVAGDDSLDVDSVAGLEIGEEHVVFDDTNQESIVITEILTSTRIRVNANLAHSYTDASLRKTSWDLPGGSAVAMDGGIYYSGPLNLGDEDQDKALVIRRSKGDADLLVYYKDTDHTSWTAVPWAWEREIDTTTADVEYAIPARGVFELMVVCAIGDSSVEPTVYHMAAVDAATGLLGDHHPPGKPVNATPADGAADIQETPTLSVSSYEHTLSTTQGGLQVQISQQTDFSVIAHDSGEQPAGISYPVPEGILTENATYYWRMRLKDNLGGWSEWSDGTSFACAATFTYIVTPSNIGPAAGATDIAEQPTLSASAFQVSGSTDTHDASQWRIRVDGGDWTTPVYDSGEVADLVSHVVPAGNLLEGQNTYYFQVRYKGVGLGWSDWSQETSFVTKDIFALIMGVALTTSGGGAGSWQHIDGDGNNITPGAAYFDNHPVWGGMQDVTIDGQAMVKVPNFYCKVGTLASGDQAGKKAWLISDQPVSGFDLHPAFMDGGVEIDQFYYGKYEAADDGGTMVKSAAGVAPLASTSFTDFKTLCAARNTGGVDGFHLVNIYEVAAIQMLALVELGTPDTQSAISVGNNTGSVQNTGVASDIYRGIYQLWSNVYSFVDGLKVTSGGDLQVFDKNGNGTYVTVASGISGLTFNGWPVSMRDNAGTDFDCKFLFLAETVDGTEGNGTFADQQYFYQGAEDYIPRHGGDWSDSSGYGLFFLDVNGAASNTYTFIGARLAKV